MSEPDPTPDEQVRRLLADARADEPMPDDVAVRLDGVIADLQGESRRTPTAVDAAPVDLAARRRRRVARTVLVAAAAVVVLGVGISRIDLSGQDAGGSADSADSGAASAPESTARDDESGGDETGDLNRLIKGRPLVLSPDSFERRARLLSLHPPLASLADVPVEEGYDGDLGVEDGVIAARGWCTDPAWGAGELIPVRYDGRRGVLVLRAPTDDSRVVDLYLCGETAPTRSTTVPAR